MVYVLLGLNLVISMGLGALLFLLLRNFSRTDGATLVSRLDGFEKAQERVERTIRDEMALSRDELSKAARGQRQELTDTFRIFGDSVVQRMIDAAGVQKLQLDGFSAQLGAFAKASGERLDAVRAESAEAAKQLRQEVVIILKTISETIMRTMAEFANAQKNQLDAFSLQLASFAKASGERLDAVRAESAAGSKQLREEVVGTLKSISFTMSQTMKDSAAAEKLQLELFSSQIATLTKSSGEKLDGIRLESAASAKHLREEVLAALKGITEATTNSMGEMANVQKARLDAMSLAIEKLSESNEKKLEAVRATVETKLESLQGDNAKQLELMRQTVDEKLQGTLEKRLGESFKQVSDRLEQVHKGLGEMQSLATGVGDLKKVLTNVKTRGTWGEVQLGTMLEQVLNPDQFATNVAIKDSGERVEFAIKLPGQGTNDGEPLWLPIDSKFPLEDYQRLVDAQEAGDIEAVDLAGKQLESRVKQNARDICEKYLSPPKTTEFAILFLPIEGLFAEVIRRTGLTDVLQREYRIVIAGPTTLWSILNIFQMGFRTLAIQQRSSEVWNLLSAVKTEWTKYGDVLDSVQKKLHQASDSIEKAKVRSRAVGKKLKDVQELPVGAATVLIPPDVENEDDLDGVETSEVDLILSDTV